MTTLSIDPGFERLGLAVIEKKQKEVLLFSECFQTSKKDSFPKRLLIIKNRLEEVIKKYKPDSISIETLFFSANTKTALAVSELRGVILVTAEQYTIPIFEYNPMQIKVAVTGNGKADKKAIIQILPKIIKIEKEIVFDDEFDAIAVGITHFAYNNKNKLA